MHSVVLRTARSTGRMALHSAADSTKYIFAPAGKEAHGQAGQFTKGVLTRADLDPRSPIRQFHGWFAAAQQSGRIAHPETCCLSTASLPSGRVSARVVYLKELDAEGGFVVYSNFGTSRKAGDLATNPWASLTFWWEDLERQVRVEGRATRLSREESQKYFDTRVRGSRIGAWASRQSQVLEPSEEADADDGRKQLEGWVKEAEKKFEGQEHIPVPEFWGGLRIVPESVEFWQGRQNRLHDRFVYTKKASGTNETTEWVLERLSP
ncbi:pyridoxamine 5'-phosphate oxidase [Xylariaceae sp. FL0594]|nr:pyridoxamine 5'-phosphate oxidase [Xylariaceae sp. FL0594]